MKWNIILGSMVLGLAMCSQSFGFELLDRMLGSNGCGCDTQCCETKCCSKPKCCQPKCCEPKCCKEKCHQPLFGGGCKSKCCNNGCGNGCGAAAPCRTGAPA